MTDNAVLASRYRTNTCGELGSQDIGRQVRLAGWVHRIRDHGGLLFVDLRDHYGITQVVFEPSNAAFKVALTLHSEWVVMVSGKTRMRPDGSTNAELRTGAIEVVATELDVLAPASELPIQVFGDRDYPEELRLTYRFLDLRRQRLHDNIMLRASIVKCMREYMHDSGFSEFTTPILTASSPEGARDFLVPSRLHPGRFYALPQAPQQFKQLLMVSGFDRYFQIAPCFRDEDARADRSPGEFYQLDIEMSFVEQEDVFDVVEPLMRKIFTQFGGGKLVTERFPRIPYQLSLSKYGTDKPDLRNPIEMQDVTAHFRNSDFRVFADILRSSSDARVWAIPAPTGGSRSFCDQINSWAQQQGQPGLAFIYWRGVDGVGSVAKNLGQAKTAEIREQLQLKSDDAVFFVAGDPSHFWRFAGLARDAIGRALGLIDESRFEFAWIVDFPLYERNKETGAIDFSHNPFSMPQGGLEALHRAERDDTILGLKAFQYDIVCNGVELSSGAIRNHRPDIMRKVFDLAGYPEEVLEEKFGGMYRALKFGAPPHGGIAPGVDRIVMLLAGASSLRDVIVFPMNQQAQDLLMGAPSAVSSKQLAELNIALTPVRKASKAKDS